MRKAQIGTRPGGIAHLITLALLLHAPTVLAQETSEEAAEETQEAVEEELSSSAEETDFSEEAPASPPPGLPPESQPSRPSAGGAAAFESPGLGFGAYPGTESSGSRTQDTTQTAAAPADAQRVFAEDWWTHTRPTVEFHGNFRVRANLFHKFALGRVDSPSTALWPHPLDHSYTDLSGTDHGIYACTPNEAGTGDSKSPGDANAGCTNSTQAGANMRFRVEPTIVISDNLRIRSQIDLFDNLVMGSTAQGYSNFPAAGGGYAVSTRDGYTPWSGATTSQGAPISGVNSMSDAVVVKRAWAEYETPFGQARFGRMPDHFGLGLHRNAGDDIDGDYQSTVDRLAFVTGIPSLSLYAMGAWDFVSEGALRRDRRAGQPAYDAAQYDDVSSFNLVLFRRVDPQLEKLMLAQGKLVINGGLYLTYAFQRIANDFSGPSATCANGGAALDCGPGQGANGFVRRGMQVWTPDVYAEIKYKKFRFGVEAITHQGTMQSTAVLPGDNDYDNPDPNGSDGWRINQWGFASEITQHLVEDRLKLGFFFGWGSGDGDVENIVPGSNGMQPQLGDRTLSTFRFHPGYRVDLILNRHILGRVQGSYYLKPMAQYDFIRDKTGMRLGGRAEAIWTRASNFMQTPGHQHDLGIELNGSIYYQSKDGSLNDNPDLVGGLYAMLQYGVLFPMGGLGYLSQQRSASGDELPGLSTAQTLRLFLGVAY